MLTKHNKAYHIRGRIILVLVFKQAKGFLIAKCSEERLTRRSNHNCRLDEAICKGRFCKGPDLLAIGDIPDGGEDPVGVAKGGLSLPGQVGAVPEEVHALTAESSNLQQARCFNQYLGEGRATDKNGRTYEAYQGINVPCLFFHALP